MALKIRDIAQELGVSMATVSMVLNDKPGISSETRKRVLDAVKRSGYYGSALKRLNFGNQVAINFVIYKKHGKVVSDTPFFSALIEGIENQARSGGYSISINYLTEGSVTFKEDFKVLTENMQQCLLLATEMRKSDLTQFMELNVPIVLLDNAMVGASVDKVLINNFEGSYKATKYLLEKGHRKIGYLHSSVWINNFDERRGGYSHAIREAGIDESDLYTVELSSIFEGSYYDMNSYLDKNPQLPTAYFADNDIIAMGAMKSLKEHGIRIPDDVSIIGFDDMPFCTMLELTTMRVHKHHMGKIAVERLVELINSKDNCCMKIEIDTEIMERQSVKNL